MNRSVIFLDLLRLTLNGLFNGWQAEQRLCVGDSAPYRFRCLSSEQMAERARCTVAANCSINYIISNTLLPVSFSCKQKTCLMFSLCMIHPTSSRIIICHQINITLFVIESWKYSFSKYKSFQPHSSKNERMFFSIGNKAEGKRRMIDWKTLWEQNNRRGRRCCQRETKRRKRDGNRCREEYNSESTFALQYNAAETCQ